MKIEISKNDVINIFTNSIIIFFFLLGSVMYLDKFIVPFSSIFGTLGILIDLFYVVWVLSISAFYIINGNLVKVLGAWKWQRRWREK
jgi:hypothetical protein